MKSTFLFSIACVSLLLGACGQDVPSDQSPPRSQQTQQPQQPEQTNAQAADGDTDGRSQDPDTTGRQTNAMALYREAQALMKAGKHQEAYETAGKAMQQFIAEDNDLAWMMLESIALEDRRIDVHFNMGPDERKPPDNGIVRPLSFRVWSTGDDEALLEVIDFEIGRMGAEPLTAAIGKMQGAMHANYGILPIDASYEAIREAVLNVVDPDENESQ